MTDGRGLTAAGLIKSQFCRNLRATSYSCPDGRTDGCTSSLSALVNLSDRRKGCLMLARQSPSCAPTVRVSSSLSPAHTALGSIFSLWRSRFMSPSAVILMFEGSRSPAEVLPAM